jgi:hypothetical protein
MNRQFLVLTMVQVLVTGLLSIQWISIYTYFIINTQHIPTMTLEETTIVFFIFNLSYQIFYINNVKFFYLSTLTSSLYRKTFKIAILEFLPEGRLFRWLTRN